MKYDFEMWFRKLKSHAENCRAANPIPSRNYLSRSQVLQHNMIKESFLSWINKLPSTISTSSNKIGGYGICIVFTSTSPGLVAAKEVMHGKNTSLVSLYPEELSDFLRAFPDNEYRYHAHLWSYFMEELDSDTQKTAERYPLKDKEQYWLHVEGIMRGPRLGRGVEHLWSWNGNQAKLLKKSFLHWAA